MIRGEIFGTAGYTCIAVLLMTNIGFAGSLFDDDAVLDVLLSGPLSTLFDDRRQRSELPFVASFDGSRLQVDVSVRGRSRLRVCEFPPLRLDFGEETAVDSPLAGQGRVKLVTPCRDYDRAEKDLLQEYLTYRILNLVQDESYRVRLLRVRYVDTDRKPGSQVTERYAFLIEPDSEFAARIGAVQAELPAVPVSRIDPEHAAAVYVFQYLIANTDWSLVRAEHEEYCCHNTDLYERDGSLVFVPYDFDLSGLVNASYAYPDPQLRIKRVTQRLYRGTCIEQSALRSGLRRVAGLEEQVLQLVAEIPGFTADDVKSSSRFLAKFFESARDEQRLLRDFERGCLD
jgi:hypothetical protein